MMLPDAPGVHAGSIGPAVFPVYPNPPTPIAHALFVSRTPRRPCVPSCLTAPAWFFVLTGRSTAYGVRNPGNAGTDVAGWHPAERSRTRSGS